MAQMKSNKKEEKKLAPISWAVNYCKQWKDGSITFGLELKVAEGRTITIYGCRIVDSKKGNFISFPSRKGSDGNYYSHAYIQLTQEEQDEIIETVMDERDDQ